MRFKTIYINFPEHPERNCESTHLNSSKGKVVLGGRPGLKVTTKKNIVKFRRTEKLFLSKPMIIIFTLSNN